MWAVCCVEDKVRRSLIVFAGGGIGACARSLLLQSLSTRGSLPLPVLLANLIGSFLLAVLFVLADEVGLLGARIRLFLAVGVLGGFTTFSTFGYGADLLIAHGNQTTVLVYVLGNVLGGITAVALGLLAGRELVAALERVAHGVILRLETGRRVTGVARTDVGLIEMENRENPG
jgi:fluoride exporter